MTRLTQRLLVLLVLVAACGSSAPPPRRALPPPPPPKFTEDDAATKVQPQTIYVYTPIGKRDPFQNVYAVKEVTAVKVPGRKPTPLQRWSLDQLRLSMAMTGTSSPMAMVEDPEGRGWPVRLGDFVGQNWGKVTSIQKDQIVVTETITDHATGRVYPSNIPIKMPRDANEMKQDEMLREGETLSPTAQNGSGK
ncbi:MAG TPA: pilus assembly protein PilP [Myxococcales bacterium]|nr:pilus assembly protein PilP [Myxococcales bacterium]